VSVFALKPEGDTWPGLDVRSVTLLKRGRSVWQPDTSLLALADGRRLVVKDMRPRPTVVSQTWGRYVLRREHSALLRLQGSGFAPEPVGMIDSRVLAMEAIDGEMLPKSAGGLVGSAFFDRLRQEIERMHREGVAHGDIRRTNVMVRRDGMPVLIDFASATIRPASLWRFVGRCVCALQRRVDLATCEKLRAVVVQGHRSMEVERNYPWFMNTGRFLRKTVYGSIKHFFAGDLAEVKERKRRRERKYGHRRHEARRSRRG